MPMSATHVQDTFPPRATTICLCFPNNQALFSEVPTRRTPVSRTRAGRERESSAATSLSNTDFYLLGFGKSHANRKTIVSLREKKEGSEYKSYINTSFLGVLKRT